MHLISPDAKSVQLIEGGEGVGKGVDSSGICYKDSKRSEIGQERRQRSEGIRGDIEFLQVVTHGESRGKGTEEIRRDVQRQKSIADLGYHVREERGNRVWR